jgi:hypothetical protein
MAEGFEKLAKLPKDEVLACLYRSRHTFAIVSPQNYKSVADSIYNANQNINWYRDNDYPGIATQISEYGIAYCQYSYSLPRPVTEFFHLFMTINHGDYFKALGFESRYYDSKTKQFDAEKTTERMRQIIANWKVKYPNLKMRFENIKYDSLLAFDISFTKEIETLNLDTK